jgi:multisubunit Na+/H+ antiporter MnhC subunit
VVTARFANAVIRPGILQHDDHQSPRIDASPLPVALVLGAVSLIGLLVTALLVVSASAARPSLLSPPTHSRIFPTWLAGPLHGLWSLPLTNSGLSVAFSVSIAAMYVFYVLAILCAPRLRRRWTIAAIVGAHLIFFISPPLQLTDVFNYLNYGRMEIVHGLNPYATIPALEPHSDPAFAISNWHHLLSPYGPLFTIFTFALVPLGVATSFWVFKASLMLVSLATLWLVWRCAELLHRDPLKATLLVGLNPLVLVWGLGGDHNDFFMMLFVMLGVYLLLSSRSRGFAAGLSVREELIGRGAADPAGSPRRRRAWRPRRGFGPALGEAIVRLRAPLLERRLVLARTAPAGTASAATVAPAPAPETRPPAPSLSPLPGGWTDRSREDVVAPRGSGAAGLGSVAGAWAGPAPSRSLAGLRGAVAAHREQALHFGCGLALICALAIKLPAAILLPIVFVVSSRRRWLLGGIAFGGVVVVLASYVAFGIHLPDLATQSDLVTGVGLPNLLGYGLGLGGETVGLHAVLTGLLLVVVALCTQWARSHGGDWIAPAAVAVFVLLATLSWQAPWYVLWLLPFAALTRRPHLRVATLVFGIYMIVAFVPSVSLSPPGSPLEHAHAREIDRLVN